MKPFRTLLAIFFVFICTATVYADIYEWIDENGVKNFTNFLPPPGAEIYIKESEIPQTRTANRPQTTARTLPQPPDENKEIRRLREELEAVKKLLAESHEVSQAAEDNSDSDQTSRTAETYDTSENIDAANYAPQTTTIRTYYFPYYGFYKSGDGHGGYYGKRHPLKRYFHQKNHYGHDRKYLRHRHEHNKHIRRNFKNPRHDIRVNKRPGSRYGYRAHHTHRR